MGKNNFDFLLLVDENDSGQFYPISLPVVSVECIGAVKEATLGEFNIKIKLLAREVSDGPRWLAIITNVRACVQFW